MVIEGIYDPTFSNGFKVSNTDGVLGNNVGTIDYMGTTTEPYWRLVQWWCNENILNGTENKIGEEFVYTDSGKQVVVNPQTGFISLELKGSNHFSSPRTFGEEWPSILLEQSFHLNNRLDELKSVEFIIHYKITHVEDYMNGMEDVNLHSAQFQWFITVQNVNTQSKKYGDYFWFGLPFYDKRYDYPKAYSSQDIGKADSTNKFIYLVDSKGFLDEPVIIGKEVIVKYSIMPEVLKALTMTQQKGYMEQVQLSDLSFGSMNIGWEVTGTYDVGVEISKLSMNIILK